VRREEAARADIKPYQVFPDTVLAELARGRPTTLDGLRRVPGVGDYRLKSFGLIFVNAIADHCRKTGLATDVPQAKVAPTATKTPAPKEGSASATKSQAFQLFRRGAAIEEVIQKTGMAASTVNGYLADFVLAEKPESIFAWVPEDVCERVAAAADIHGTERLKPVFLELNEEVSYDHIRIVIAFLQSRG
jgi:ATP-dependent DNA helicase RecQ